MFVHMKRTAKAYTDRRYPDPRQRDRKFLLLALGIGAIGAAFVGLIVYLMSRGAGY